MPRMKAALLMFFALIVPACGGGNTIVSPPLLSETFNGTFPGANWTTPATTGASAPTVAVSGGALKFTATGVTSSAATTTTAGFASPPVTFQLQMTALTTAVGQKGIGTIEILNGTNVVVAAVSWNAETSPTQVTYTFQGTPLPGGPFNGPASDGATNLFRFSVSGAGLASWSLNNTEIGTQAGFPAGPFKLRIGASFGTPGPWPEFGFDNINITSP